MLFLFLSPTCEVKNSDRVNGFWPWPGTFAKISVCDGMRVLDWHLLDQKEPI